ncbi:LOW QUALITY PROTEIN: Prolyl oligopeptidase [Colletotrichum higginsianum IMI 349063]|uniref:Prolyl oligopeptidase n=1 Tax=Colletotrichum higginsianum (strain IMI 349063) TaxID=759273 RepID=A0A1B7YTQ0_COLHI|nr:LOW QUALITY PROTEIN: Prolyl oligopeptidase [Colletotrichum higginsianum IMI 349063]OBR15411.1 LOW QUALITY PROTEIN: Prolyl oligopeptidase [Colletotrichum higginsianum IMI 349063]
MKLLFEVLGVGSSAGLFNRAPSHPPRRVDRQTFGPPVVMLELGLDIPTSMAAFPPSFLALNLTQFIAV